MKIAVITGASSGMGRQFVKHLDNEGFDQIWGIALNKEKLDSVTEEIKTPFRAFAIDLTKDEQIQTYVDALNSEKPEVQWLVNCSGYAKFGDYSQIPIKTSINMIDLNCSGLVKMTELTLPYMKEGGRIIEIASMAALQATPYMNVYGASKAFVLSYSRGLSAELKPRGISVTCVCPLWTKTNFQKTAELTSSAINHFSSSYSAEAVVKKGIADARKHKLISVYGSKARMQWFIVKTMPHKWVMSIWTRQQQKKRKEK